MITTFMNNFNGISEMKMNEISQRCTTLKVFQVCRDCLLAQNLEGNAPFKFTVSGVVNTTIISHTHKQYRSHEETIDFSRNILTTLL